jgi:2-methylcitrate dehydratase PrpD
MSAALSQLVAQIRFETLPTGVTHKASMVVLDTMGVILGGAASPDLRRLARTLSPTGPASLLGGGRVSSVRDAALWNGTAGSVLELYEGSRFTRGPTAIQFVPAALAEAERLGASGRSLIVAVVAGYEVASRMARAGHLRDAHHPCGTWGVMGAAAAVASLRGFDWKLVEATIELGGTLCLTTSLDTVREGATVRNIYAGLANSLGLLAADLAGAGFTPLPAAPARVYGQLLSDRFDASVLDAGLGRSYEIELGYFKRHACYRHSHAALDALDRILAREPVDAATIHGIRVYTYDFAARLTNPMPETTLAAQFSIPHALAAFCVLRQAGPDAFAPAALSDPRIGELRRRVVVMERPEYTAMQPHRRPATVEVELANGQTFSETVELPRGEPEDPLTPAELDAKFLPLASASLGTDRASALNRELRRLDSAANVQPILALGRGPEAE